MAVVQRYHSATVMQRCHSFNFLVRNPISAAGIAADDGQHLAGDVAGAGPRREEHEGWRNLLWLGRPLHRRVGAKLGDPLGGFVGRIERCPDRPGRHRIDANAAIDEMRGKRASEGMMPPLVIE